ncbi:hypothetical protein GUJ93_ZPchr0121g48 [Zizania palustris]|uniref:GATA-type domain-containing protein n=1 Tax=Zizania palustris TaxID=103762 RepID=A0A8J5QW20_ZIZPA|nr:hypothetical protein GUJ93_ZPchr0121g48 [Zizania palustris]
MSTIYISQLPATLPLMEGDRDQELFPAFHRAKDPPILFPFMIDSLVQHQEGQSYGEQHLRQRVLGESNQQLSDHMTIGRSDVFLAPPSPFRPTIQSIGSDMIKRSSYDDPYDIDNKDESQQLQQQAGGVVRVCSDCNTTKTPLWRSGPCGPKSLCNACGIRQRKARRAAAAAANGGAAAVRTTVMSSAPVKQPAKKEKRTDVDRSLPFKKRCKMANRSAAPAAAAVTAAPRTAAAGIVAAPNTNDDGDHHVAVAAAENLVANKGASPPPPAFFHGGLPRDEITDAAMLLMTLSCGLVRS